MPRKQLLDEIERVSDQVAMMVSGKVVLSGPLDTVKESHHRLTLRFETAPARPPSLAGALSVKGGGQEWTVICNGALGELIAEAANLGARVVEQGVPSLEEIFVARVGAKSLKTQPLSEPT